MAERLRARLLGQGRRSRAVLDGPRCNRLDRSGIRCTGGKELQPEAFVLQARRCCDERAVCPTTISRARNATQQMRNKLDDPRAAGVPRKEPKIKSLRRSSRPPHQASSGIFRGRSHCSSGVLPFGAEARVRCGRSLSPFHGRKYVARLQSERILSNPPHMHSAPR
jgi:hypothetical protein